MVQAQNLDRKLKPLNVLMIGEEKSISEITGKPIIQLKNKKGSITPPIEIVDIVDIFYKDRDKNYNLVTGEHFAEKLRPEGADAVLITESRITDKNEELISIGYPSRVSKKYYSCFIYFRYIGNNRRE